MKSKKLFRTFFIIFLITGVVGIITYLASIKSFKSSSSNEQVMVTINNITQTAAMHWEDSSSAFSNAMKNVYSQEDSLHFSVLSLEDTVLFSTLENDEISLTDAAKQHYTVYPLVIHSVTSGYIVIHDNLSDVYLSSWKNIALLWLILFLILLILTIFYAIFIHKNVIKPFTELQNFAASIASGNLDIPLPMNSHNAFGAFTESFDLMREELALAKEKEQAANRSKKELILQLNHDLKTPVASIKAISELMLALENQNPSSKYIKKLKNINDKADQIDMLMSNLFSATLEEVDELHVHPDFMYTTDFLTMLEQSDYQHRITPFQPEACMVLADKLRLQQVFDNIINNSYKYADTPIHITTKIIETENFDNKKKSYYLLTVHDSGTSCDAETLPLLTNKFYRGDNTTKIHGSGLGLYIAKQIMEKMHGHLSLNCDETGFFVHLYFTTDTTLDTAPNTFKK